MICKGCKGTDFRKNGTRLNKRGIFQSFQCKNCGTSQLGKTSIKEIKKKILLLLIIVSSLVPMVSAFETSYSVMPGSGSCTETILITVRSDPIIDEKPMWVSIFWDKRLVESRIPSPVYGKTQYQHRWDITITPPPDHAEVGKHRIEIWMETQDGGITVLPWQYTIDDGLPPFSVWDEFLEANPEILAQIMGPKGDTGFGQTGNTGPKGNRGEPGKVGVIGPQGEVGGVGPVGAVGEIGKQGSPGVNASYAAIGVLFILSIAVSMGFTYYWTSTQEAKLRIEKE